VQVASGRVGTDRHAFRHRDRTGIEALVPDFNVADSAIVCGGILLVLDALRSSHDTSPQ